MFHGGTRRNRKINDLELQVSHQDSEDDDDYSSSDGIMKKQPSLANTATKRRHGANRTIYQPVQNGEIGAIVFEDDEPSDGKVSLFRISTGPNGRDWDAEMLIQGEATEPESSSSESSNDATSPEDNVSSMDSQHTLDENNRTSNEII